MQKLQLRFPSQRLCFNNQSMSMPAGFRAVFFQGRTPGRASRAQDTRASGNVWGLKAKCKVSTSSLSIRRLLYLQQLRMKMGQAISRLYGP